MKIPRTFLTRTFNKSGPPIHLIWFVTARCDLRCTHCFYHEEVANAHINNNDFSLDEFRKTLDTMSPLLSVTFTGGEPYVRSDFFEIVELFCRKNLAENILLFTNGVNSDRVLTVTEKILSSFKDTHFCVTVSVDGFEKEHDETRQLEGAYQQTLHTIKELKKLESRFRICVLVSTLHSIVIIRI